MQPKRELRIREVDQGAGQGKEEAETRKDTEKHGKDRSRGTEGRISRSRRNSHGNKTLLSEPDA